MLTEPDLGSCKSHKEDWAFDLKEVLKVMKELRGLFLKALPCDLFVVGLLTYDQIRRLNDLEIPPRPSTKTHKELVKKADIHACMIFFSLKLFDI